MYNILDGDTNIRHKDFRTVKQALDFIAGKHTPGVRVDTNQRPAFIAKANGDLVALVYCGVAWYSTSRGENHD